MVEKNAAHPGGIFIGDFHFRAGHAATEAYRVQLT